MQKPVLTPYRDVIHFYLDDFNRIDLIAFVLILAIVCLFADTNPQLCNSIFSIHCNYYFLQYFQSFIKNGRILFIHVGLYLTVDRCQTRY